jgi:hypothetical protein
MTHSDSNQFNPLQTITGALIEEQLKTELRTEWNISPEAQALCDIYYLLHWSNKAFNSRFRTHYTRITRDGVEFKIQWNCSQGAKKLIFQAERIGLSFRRLQGSEAGIVIPKIMKGMSAP